MAIAALGLAFVWGTLGILNLGHSVFFGLGAYAYAVATSNLGDSTPGLLIGIILPVAFSLVLGYFLFFSRLGDVYLGVITLCVTLIFYSFATSTADPSYHIGSVLLGGFNGITAIPPLNMPADPQTPLSVEATFSICLLTLAGIYILLSFLRASNAGRIMAAIRENELRSELLGYDIRFYKLVGFAVSAAVAGLAGALYTAVMGFVGPNVFDLPQASQFVLWVIAGGLGTFAGPTLASFGFQLLSSQLGANQIFNTELIFGATILLFVLLVPRGLLPMILSLADPKLPRRLSGLVRKEKPV
ncbi:branched-chain amino acid ABC transporter permease [Labrys okinawensis]|uniref:branched-chain amino acid ABC transporter permease n=1 Tax=Labrys okinawensis TaxID=346911 RepID=UPI0039BC4147